VSVVSHIPSPVRHAIPVPCVVSPHLPLSCVHGPRSSFPVPTSLVPPSFPLFGPCCLSCPCAWCALSPSPSPSPSPSWSWSLHPPIHPVSSCSQRRWGVLGCGSGCSPRASRPCCASLPHASGSIVPSLSLVLPVFTPRAVARGGGLGCCCAGRRGRHSATGRGQRRRGGVMGAYLAGIPLQGSPSTLRMLFIVRTSSSFGPSFIVVRPSYIVVCCSYVIVRRSSSFVRCRCSYVVVVRSFVRRRMLFVVLHMLSYVVRTSSFICRRTLFVVLRPSYVVPVAMYLEIYLKTVY
jgi:hypothetical protein